MIFVDTRKRVITFVWLCFVLCPLVDAQNKRPSSSVSPHIYELYSWQDSNGGWNFSLVPNTSSEKSVAWVFNKKVVSHGMDRLREKISLLPEGATIALLDRFPTGPGPKAKGSESLTYPPPDIVIEIRRHAATRKIEVLGVPAQSDGWHKMEAMG